MFTSLRLSRGLGENHTVLVIKTNGDHGRDHDVFKNFLTKALTMKGRNEIV